MITNTFFSLWIVHSINWSSPKGKKKLSFISIWTHEFTLSRIRKSLMFILKALCLPQTKQWTNAIATNNIKVFKFIKTDVWVWQFRIWYTHFDKDQMLLSIQNPIGLNSVCCDWWKNECCFRLRYVFQPVVWRWNPCYLLNCIRFNFSTVGGKRLTWYFCHFQHIWNN